MTARKFYDLVKIKIDVRTDKELAEEMGVKYTSVTSALARDSIQYELIIKLLLQKGIDLNEIFSVLLTEDSDIDLRKVVGTNEKTTIDNVIEYEAEQLAQSVKSTYINLADHSTIKEIKLLQSELRQVIDRFQKR